MEKKFKLQLPTPQNFIRILMPPKPREEGWNPAPLIDIADLSEEEAIEYGEQLKQDFIRHWKQRSSKPTVCLKD